MVILLDVKVSDSFSRKKQKRDRFEKDKTFALKIASTYRKLAKKYPEIISEIKLLIYDQISHQTAAFKARAKKLLKEFERNQ